VHYFFWPFEYWDSGFESHLWHGRLSALRWAEYTATLTKVEEG